MIGGAGNDTYVVDAAGDVVTELAGQGTDTVQCSISYTLGANVENLHSDRRGEHQRHRQYRQQHADRQWRQQRARRRRRQRHHERRRRQRYLWVDAAGDVVTELAGQGTDTVQAASAYTLGANVENLHIDRRGDINATGNTGNNTLTGNAGNNVLNGGAGNDIMIGGAGNDTMTGGAGHDVFVYMQGNGSDIVNGGTGASWIDTVQLDQSLGLQQLGTDWTVTLTSGSVVGQNANQLSFSADADGAINLADGSQIVFTDMERVQW